MGQNYNIENHQKLPGYMTTALLETMLFSDRRKCDRGLPTSPFRNGGTVVIANAEALDEQQKRVYHAVVSRSGREQGNAVTLRKGDFGEATTSRDLRDIIAKLTLVNIIHVTDTDHRVIPLMHCSYASDETVTLSLAPEIKAIYSNTEPTPL